MYGQDFHYRVRLKEQDKDYYINICKNNIPYVYLSFHMRTGENNSDYGAVHLKKFQKGLPMRSNCNVVEGDADKAETIGLLYVKLDEGVCTTPEVIAYGEDTDEYSDTLRALQVTLEQTLKTHIRHFATTRNV
jgi:hypothetical protein